jgi:hypothetical protein
MTSVRQPYLRRASAPHVFRCLRARTGPDGTVETRLRDLAHHCGVGVNTARGAVADLVAAGLVEVVKRGTGNGHASIYRVVSEHTFPAVCCPLCGNEVLTLRRPGEDPVTG